MVTRAGCDGPAHFSTVVIFGSVRQGEVWRGVVGSDAVGFGFRRNYERQNQEAIEEVGL
jgi:hypothetical protein